MPEWDPDLVKRLLNENQDFRVLYEEHLQLEKQLQVLASLHYLTPNEEIKKRELQKKKLAGKDKMELIVRSHQQEGAGG